MFRTMNRPLSPHCSFAPRGPRTPRQARVRAGWLAAATALCLFVVSPSYAASPAPDPSTANAVLAGSPIAAWADYLRGAMREAFAPLRAGFAYVMQGAADRATTVHVTIPADAWAGYDAAPAPQALASVWGGTLPFRPDLTPPDGTSSVLLLPRRFAMPWLVAPDNVFHQMPALAISSAGPVHVDLVGASLGGHTGAVIGQVVVRF